MSGSTQNDTIDAADDRTLRLSAPEISPERLDKLIAFQRKFASAAERALSRDATMLARLHEEALKASDLSARDLHELEALARAYCGRRWTVQALEQRLALAEERVAQASREGRAPAAKDVQAVEKLPEEIRQRAELTRLERRYGEATIGLLRAREKELLALHEVIGEITRR